jgi:hypothetical protein
MRARLGEPVRSAYVGAALGCRMPLPSAVVAISTAVTAIGSAALVAASGRRWPCFQTGYRACGVVGPTDERRLRTTGR